MQYTLWLFSLKQLLCLVSRDHKCLVFFLNPRTLLGWVSHLFQMPNSWSKQGLSPWNSSSLMYLPLSFLSFMDLNISLNHKKHLIFNLFQLQKWQFQCYVYANSQIHVSIHGPLLKLQTHLPSCLPNTSAWMSRKHLQVKPGSSERNLGFPPA